MAMLHDTHFRVRIDHPVYLVGSRAAHVQSHLGETTRTLQQECCGSTSAQDGDVSREVIV